MTTHNVDELKTFISSYFGSISNLNYYKHLIATYEKDNETLYDILRLIIEEATFAYVQKAAVTDGSLESIETRAKRGPLNVEIYNTVKFRYQFEGLQLTEIPTEGAMSHIGFTEDEAVLWHGILKKSGNELPLFAEDAAKVWEEKHVIIDSNQQILSYTYFVVAWKCLGQIRDCFNQNWVQVEKENLACQLYAQNISPKIAVHTNYELNPNIWDIYFASNWNEETAKLAALWNTFTREIENDPFLRTQSANPISVSEENQTVILNHSWGAMCIATVIAEMQNEGKQFTADNISAKFMSNDQPFQKLRQIEILKEVQFNMLRDQDNQMQMQFDNERLNAYDNQVYNLSGTQQNEWDRKWNEQSQKVAMACRDSFYKDCLEAFNGNRNIQEYMEELAMNLINECRNKFDTAIGAVSKRIRDADQIIQKNKDEIMADKAKVDSEENKTQRVRIDKNVLTEQVEKYLKEWYPKYTAEDLQNELKKYEGKTQEHALQELYDAHARKGEEWDAVLSLMVSPKIEENYLKQKVPELFEIIDEEHPVFEKKLEDLKNEYKGDGLKARENTFKEINEYIPYIKNQLSSTDPWLAKWTNLDFIKLLDYYDLNFKKMKEFVDKIHPLVQKISYYNPYYHFQNTKWIVQQDGFDSIVEKLNKELAMFEERKAKFQKNDYLKAFVERKKDIATWEDIVGHCKDEKEVEKYVIAKDAYRQKCNINDCNDLEFIDRFHEDMFYNKNKANGDVNTLYNLVMNDDDIDVTLLQDADLPEEIKKNVKYWNDIDNGSLRKEYVEIEKNFSIFQRINKIAAESKTFEEYIIKKKGDKYTSEKSCFLGELSKEINYVKDALKGLETDLANLRNTATWTEPTTQKHWKFVEAAKLWNDVFPNEKITSEADAVILFRNRKVLPQNGIEYLVREASAGNNNMEIDGRLKKAKANWFSKPIQKFVQLESDNEMIHRLGGAQQYISFLGQLEIIVTYYLEYYPTLRIDDFFKDLKDDEVIGTDELLQKIDHKIKTAINDCRTIGSKYAKINTEYQQLQMQNGIPKDKTILLPIKLMYKKFGNNEELFDRQIRIILYNERVKYLGKDKTYEIKSDLENRILYDGDNGKTLLNEKEDSLTKEATNKSWWTESPDAIAFRKFMNERKDGKKNLNDIEKTYSTKDSKEIYQMMINQIAQIYERRSGTQFVWTDNPTDLSEKFNQILSATKNYIEKLNDKKGNTKLRDKFKKAKKLIPYQKFGAFTTAYPNDQEAELYLDRILLEQKFRQTTKKREINYPDGIDDDAKKIDWMNDTLVLYNKVDMPYFDSQEFLNLWSVYLKTTNCPYTQQTKNKFIQDMQVNKLNAQLFMVCAIRKDNYVRMFKSYPSEWSNLDAKQQIDFMTEKMDLVNKMKKRYDLINEMNEYNTANSTDLTPEKMVQDKERQTIEQWLVFLKFHNLIRKIVQLGYGKENDLRTKFLMNAQGVNDLEKMYNDAQNNQKNFNTPEMAQLIKDYETICRRKLDFQELIDTKPKYKDAFLYLKVQILKAQLTDDFGYSSEELTKFLQKNDEDTYELLQAEVNKCIQDIQKLYADQTANNYLATYQKLSQLPSVTFEQLFKEHGHKAENVMFYIVYFDYYDKIEKKTESEIKSENHNDIGKALNKMMQALDVYYNRKKLFEEDSDMPGIMTQHHTNYEKLMRDYPELMSSDIEKDLRNAKYLFSNSSDLELYQRYLLLVNEEDETLEKFTKNQGSEKRKYLLNKLKEFEDYEQNLGNAEMNALFNEYKINNPGEVVEKWWDRYKLSKKWFNKIDYDKLKQKVLLNNQQHLFEANFNKNWKEQEESKLNDEEQLDYLLTVNGNQDKYKGYDLQSAIDEYNDVFPTDQLKLQSIIKKWKGNTNGARMEILRKARIEKVKELLGNNFNENDYPNSEEGLEKLKSVIDFENSKRSRFASSGGDVQKELDTYNEYFEHEPNRDLVWVRNEFQNDSERAINGLQIYQLIDKMNEFYGPDTYKREDIHKKILESSDKGKGMLREFVNHFNEMTKAIKIFRGYYNDWKPFQDACAYYAKQHGIANDLDDLLLKEGIFQNSNNKYPNGLKAIAEIYRFYRNSLYPKNEYTKEFTFATKLNPIIEDLMNDIEKIQKIQSDVDSNDNFKILFEKLHLTKEKEDDIKSKYDNINDLKLHLEIYELIKKFNENNPEHQITDFNSIHDFTYRSLQKEDLKEYLKVASQYNWKTMDKLVQDFLNEYQDRGNDFIKFSDINDLKGKMDNAFEARCYLVLEPLRLDYNRLSGRNFTLDYLLKNNKYDIPKIQEYLDNNVVYMKYLKSKGREVMLLEENEDTRNKKPKDLKKQIKIWKERLGDYESMVEDKAKEGVLTRKDITKEQMEKFVESKEDVPTIMKVLDHLPNFNAKLGQNLNADNLDQLCMTPNDWNSAYFNVRMLPLIQQYNIIASRMSEKGISSEEVIEKYITKGDDKVKIKVELVDAAFPEFEKDVKKKRDEYLEPKFKEFKEHSDEHYEKVENVLKMYPNLDDADRFLRIERYCSPIRKIIRKIKTMKYEIPHTLELDENKWKFETVNKTNPNTDYLESQIQQVHAQYEALLKQFEEKDAEERKNKNVLNPKINDINRMRRKLGMSEITYDKYKTMEFENAKQALDDEKRDLEEKQREKDNQKFNSVGGGFNSGTSMGGTIGQPLRFAALNAQRQTNPISSTTTNSSSLSTTSSNTFTRPGFEVNKSGIGDLTRANAPLRLTGFNRDTPKPASDNLFSMKSKFDSDSDDDNPIKPKNDFTKPLRPSNKFAPPVSLRRWILDKQRAQRLKKDNYPATPSKPSTSSLFSEKKEESEIKWSDDDDDTDLPEIKPISSPVILVSDNNPEDKIESIKDKLDELKESDLTLIKKPKMPNTGQLLPIPIDKKTKIKTNTGTIELPTRARKDAPLYAAQAVEVIPQRPILKPVESKVMFTGPSLDEEFVMPTPRLPPRPVQRRETFTPNRNTTKQEVDRKLMELRQRNRMKNAPLRVQRQQQRAIPQATYQPPIQVNNTPISILENPQLKALMRL